jgi:TPR repeat protein
MAIHIKRFNKKANSCTRTPYVNSYARLRSSASFWIILVASGLVLAQGNFSKAMDGDPNKPTKRCLRHPSSPSNHEDGTSNTANFYKDAEHPLTQENLKEKGLSGRLKKIKAYIDLKRERNQNYNPKEISREDFEEYKRILRCSDCESQPNSEIEYLHLPEIRNPKPLGEGYGGATLYEFFDTNTGTPVIIKKFYDNTKSHDKEKIERAIHAGIEELVYSLIALEINPAPQELKMVRMYDAILCPKDSLSIMMERAKGEDILASLKKRPKDGIKPEDVVKAIARYLATSHIRNHLYGFKSLKQQEENLDHTANFLHTLLENLLEDQGGSSFFSLQPGKEITDLQEITSRNIIRLLPIVEQKKFAHLVRTVCSHFRKNAEEIFGALKNKQPQNLYPLTIVFGDAHGRNFFYSTTFENGSLYCISAIDFATIIRTLGVIADPAEDVGRFLGSIRNLEAESQEIQQIDSLQDLFLTTYLQTIHESPIATGKDFDKIFKENANFYKLRYYKPIFNSPNNRVKAETKKKLLQSWIKENAHLEILPEEPFIRKPSNRTWQPVDGETYGYLPDRSIEFIESVDKESGTTYLDRLYQQLHKTGKVTLTPKASTTAIATGMGGIGKTSLALEYAHEALKNKAYSLIYWLPSGSKEALIKAYRNLLEENNISTKEMSGDEVIERALQEIPQIGKCLLIYDNVDPFYDYIPAPTFLEGKVPKNDKAHILVTSRSNEGWEEKWGSPITLDVFCPKDSIEYLLSVTGLEENDENKEIAGKLAKELQHLPLALAHAAHYIKLEGASRETFENYLKGFQELSTAYFEEKKNSFTDPNSKLTYDHLIARTLRMSRKFISELAKEIMGYCAYLNPDSIPEGIFLDYWADREKSETSNFFSPNDLTIEGFFLGSEPRKQEIENALSQLASLSLIKRSQNQPIFSMHRLLQSVVRNEKESTANQHQKIFSRLTSRFNTLYYQIRLNPTPKDYEIRDLENFIYDRDFKYIIRSTQLGKLLPHILNLCEHSRRLRNFSGEAGVDLEDIRAIRTLTLLEILVGSPHPALKPYSSLHAKWLIMAAKQGDVNIQGLLGKCYYDGRMVKQDYEEAVKWYTTAAERGDRPSQYHLGMMYYNGQGVEKDYGEAVQWFTKSEEEGCDTYYKNADAPYYLGIMYCKGQGVEQDYAEGRKWLTQAAERGHKDAQYRMGVMYCKGQGVEKDYVTAIHWLTKAAKQGNTDAQFNLGMMHAYGRGIPQNDRKAVKWYQKAADQGHADARCNLVNMYKKGRGIEQGYGEAAELKNKGAQYVATKAKNVELGEGSFSEDELVIYGKLAAELEEAKEFKAQCTHLCGYQELGSQKMDEDIQEKPLIIQALDEYIQDMGRFLAPYFAFLFANEETDDSVETDEELQKIEGLLACISSDIVVPVSPFEEQRSVSVEAFPLDLNDEIITNLSHFGVALEQEEEGEHGLANYNYHLAFEK